MNLASFRGPEECTGDDDRSTDANPARFEQQQETQMEVNTRSISLRSLVIGIATVGVLAIALVIYSQQLTTRDFDQNTALIRLMQSVQQEIATAHSWFEEAYGDERYVDLNRDIRGRIGAAQSLVIAAQNGGSTTIGESSSLPEAHDNLAVLWHKLDEFDQLLTARWESRSTTGIIDGAQHEQFDVVFGEILTLLSTIAGQIEAAIAADRRRISVLNVAIIGILLVLIILIVVLVTWKPAPTG